MIYRIKDYSKMSKDEIMAEQGTKPAKKIKK